MQPFIHRITKELCEPVACMWSIHLCYFAQPEWAQLQRQLTQPMVQEVGVADTAPEAWRCAQPSRCVVKATANVSASSALNALRHGGPAFADP